jgi:hypothetical protein
MANIYTMTDTWNNIGTVFTAIKMDVTDTNSADGSKLLDLQKDSVSKFSVDKTGNVEISAVWNDAGVAFHGFKIDITNTASAFNSEFLALSADGKEKIVLTKFGHMVLGRGDTTAVDKGFEVIRYLDGSGNAERFFWGYQGTDGIFNYWKSGTGTLSQVKIQYDGSTKIRLLSDGPHFVPATSATPLNNGDMCFETTSNTTLTVKFKGSDGVVRSTTLTLS